MARAGGKRVIIIGGGHNGLTCACYLAARGLEVQVLERRGIVGGAAVTEEFHPGFFNSTASYTVSLLSPKVIRDLRLHEHGLRILERPLDNFLPLNDAEALTAGPTDADTARAVARFSPADAERLSAYNLYLERMAAVLRERLLTTPPNIGGGWRDLVRGLGLGARLKRLDMRGRRDLLDCFTKSAGEILDGWFDTAALKALLAFDSVVGSYASPYSAGSAYVLLHHVMGEVNGKRGAWGHAVGGMGAITQAMAREAQARGVRITTDAEVSRVNVRDGRARGVALSDGRERSADAVVANVDPRTLYTQLIEAPHLDAELLQRMRQWRCGSASLRMNVALSELPDFACRPGKNAQAHHGAGIVIAPSLGYMDSAYLQARQHGWSTAPIIEMVIPSVLDDTLAPRGYHVASLFCQHFAPQLPDGTDWDAAREHAADAVVDAVTEYAPNFKASVIARQVLTPRDLERRFALPAGDIFHGALTPDQLYSARPALGYADYRGPLGGLYMCGAGTHPGGGVTGAPGHNAAREILRDFGRRAHR